MKILLTNDDGIHAPGLEVLEAIARQFSDDIWICAPDEEQSGMGHALTLTRPVRLRKHGERRFSVTGTPTDAVTMGLRKVMDGTPDLILSGVNRGANLGDDVTYSGTVSAAIEGALAGIRSIALQPGDQLARARRAPTPSTLRGHGARRCSRPLLDTPLARTHAGQRQFPRPPRAAGAAASARCGRASTTIRAARWSKGRDPRGFKYYWFGLEAIEHTLDHGTDLEAIAEGYVSVTPLQLDLTHHASLGNLADRYAG